jgi:hypothetical protein
LNVAKITSLSDGNLPIIVVFIVYVVLILVVIIFILIIVFRTHRPSTLSWLKGWTIFFILVMMGLAITAMALSKKGSGEDMGYTYATVILIHFVMVFLLLYTARAKIRIAPNRFGQGPSMSYAQQGMVGQANYSDQNSFNDYGPGSGSGFGQNYGQGFG